MGFKDLGPLDLKIYLDLEPSLVLFISHQLSINNNEKKISVTPKNNNGKWTKHTIYCIQTNMQTSVCLNNND